MLRNGAGAKAGLRRLFPHRGIKVIQNPKKAARGMMFDDC